MSTRPVPTGHTDENGDATADADLTARRARVRQHELLLLLEQWGPGYQRVTGNGVRYVAEIAKATSEEWQWLAEHVRSHPDVFDVPERGHAAWFDLRSEQGRAAYAAALTAFDSGDYDTARDRLDDALAHRELAEDEWRRLHHHVTLTARRAKVDTGAGTGVSVDPSSTMAQGS